MKKSLLVEVLSGYRSQLESTGSKKNERRLERLFILEDMADLGKHNSKFIYVELEDSGVSSPIKNPLNVRDCITLNRNICDWLDGPEYDLVSY